MKPIIATYVYCHTQPRGVRMMPVTSESHCFDEANPPGNGNYCHQMVPAASTGLRTGVTIKIQLPNMGVKSMHAEALTKQETDTNAKLRLFSLYVDFAASVPARWASGVIANLVGSTWKTHCEMWNLDTFKSSQQLRELMLQDAAEADVLVIALSSLDQRQTELI